MTGELWQKMAHPRLEPGAKIRQGVVEGAV